MIPAPIIKEYNGIKVVCDHLLPGGTKFCLMDEITKDSDHLVYASPVYGSFQIALAAYCATANKQCTIFSASRNNMHDNTRKVISLGARVIQVPHGYLNVVEKAARDFCISGAKKLEWGAHNQVCIDIISDRVKQAIQIIGHEPKEIWCAIGSGTLVESILKGTQKAAVYGVQVGKVYPDTNLRLYLKEYPKEFATVSKYEAPFQCTPNYDLKAWEYCNRYKQSDDVLFWNVY